MPLSREPFQQQAASKKNKVKTACDKSTADSQPELVRKNIQPKEQRLTSRKNGEVLAQAVVLLQLSIWKQSSSRIGCSLSPFTAEVFVLAALAVGTFCLGAWTLRVGHRVLI